MTGLALAIGLSSIGEASPTGTPAANRVPTGKGTSFGGLFDDMVGGNHDNQTTDVNGEKSKPPRKRLSAAEWRKAYIARHGHDLPSLSHPGH
jgi:hypothetical protein